MDVMLTKKGQRMRLISKKGAELYTRRPFFVGRLWLCAYSALIVLGFSLTAFHFTSLSLALHKAVNFP